ncbi:MAG: ribose 5-phosphate isomerase B [Myxococcales bacterium]|nr:ribose 5-phosphate isomerase B [Myxococcales bacterium]
MRTLAIGSDHAGFNLKQALAEHLRARLGDDAVLDMGPPSAARVDYPDYAAKVADAVLAGTVDGGVLICGTGIGISIAANKRAGIRAALCHDVTTARMARAHNDAQIVALGSRVVGEQVARDLVDAFLETAFEVFFNAAAITEIYTLEPGA